jgi:hypothetical protein
MRTIESYRPTEAEEHLALQGAMSYVAGVSILHDPIATQEYHRMSMENEQWQIVDAAAEMILRGTTKIIRNANPPQYRGSLAKMRPNFDIALPAMLETQIALYEEEGGLAQQHFPAIAAMIPFPVLEEGIYKRFCHGDFRGPKLPIRAMMDGVPVAASLQSFCRPQSVMQRLMTHSMNFAHQSSQT